VPPPARCSASRGRARLAQRVVVLKPLIAWLVVWVNVAAGCVGAGKPTPPGAALYGLQLVSPVSAPPGGGPGCTRQPHRSRFLASTAAHALSISTGSAGRSVERAGHRADPSWWENPGAGRPHATRQ